MLTPPPRDAAGVVTPHDHEGIKGQDAVIRRISPYFVIEDPKTGPRISTLALNPSSDGYRGLSVDLQAEIEQAGLDAKDFVSSPPWLGSIVFTAARLRGEGFQVGYDPLPDNPYHGEAWGNFAKSKQRALLRLAAWLVQIDGVSIT